jgi:RimJ/RimL family protein N-acetyltransferase
VKLVDAYRVDEAPALLYRLLQERNADVNISHRAMPTWRQHLAFIRARPYRAWYLIRVGPSLVGAVYLSKQNEIGVFVLREHQGRGYGSDAIRKVMARHRGVKRFLANINPRNPRSIALFTDLGFRHIQNTYELMR